MVRIERKTPQFDIDWLNPGIEENRPQGYSGGTA